MSKPMTVVNLRLQSQKLEHDPNTRAAADKRRQTINKQIDEFFAKGGEIKRLPAYDEVNRDGNHAEVR
jgi:hypothetical protein